MKERGRGEGGGGGSDYVYRKGPLVFSSSKYTIHSVNYSKKSFSNFMILSQ